MRPNGSVHVWGTSPIKRSPAEPIRVDSVGAVIGVASGSAIGGGGSALASTSSTSDTPSIVAHGNTGLPTELLIEQCDALGRRAMFEHGRGLVLLPCGVVVEHLEVGVAEQDPQIAVAR